MNKDERNDCEDFTPQEIVERPYYRCTLCGEYAFVDEGQFGNIKAIDIAKVKTFVCNECVELIEGD